jgi:hypothetical protein
VSGQFDRSRSGLRRNFPGRLDISVESDFLPLRNDLDRSVGFHFDIGLGGAKNGRLPDFKERPIF